MHLCVTDVNNCYVYYVTIILMINKYYYSHLCGEEESQFGKMLTMG